MEIRVLSPSDDRTRFRSGSPDLDYFFHRFAGQNQFRHHLGVTYVAAADRQIVGFVTVAAGQIEVQSLPVRTRRSLPQYPLPILRVARLAVAESDHGRGIGAALLRFSLNLALEMKEKYGCVGVVVDAKHAALGFYGRYGFFPFETIEGGSAARPATTLLFLALRTLEASTEPAEGDSEARPPRKPRK